MHFIYDLEAPSPNHGGPRYHTDGIVLHSTRGGAPLGLEFDGTLNWFANPNSQVSAHAVIRHDGYIARCVDEGLIAWHAGNHNSRWLGVELEQPRRGDPISDLQYRTLARWCLAQSEQFGCPLRGGLWGNATLIEHKDTPQGIGAGKSDIDAPFSVDVLLWYIEQPEEGDQPPMTDEQKAAIREIAADGLDKALRIGGYAQELANLQHPNYAEALTSTDLELRDLMGRLNSIADET